MTEPFIHTSTEVEETFDFTPPQGLTVLLSRYYIELLGPSREANSKGPVVATNYGLSKELLKEIEENINDLLPAPFKVRVVA